MISLINKIKLLGLAISILISIMTYLSIEYAINSSKGTEVTNAILLYKYLAKRPSSTSLNEYLLKNGLEEIKKNKIRKILLRANHVLKTAIYREVFQSGDIKLYIYNEYYYYIFSVNNKEYYYKNLQKADDTIIYIYIAVTFLMIIFLVIGIYIIEAIKPLKELHKKIHIFANKDQGFNNEYFAKNIDEVKEVSLAFDDAEKKIKYLEETRMLFWHNVMHELKTPITQGFLLTHMVDLNRSDKNSYKEIFQKMQTQLDKLKEIEYIKSDSMNLNFQRISMTDLIEDIQDNFNISTESLEYIPVDRVYNLNIEYFVVALKNLILNAITYSDNQYVKIIHKNDNLYIINSGNKLPKAFSFYTQPFTRAEQRTSGMGLGLYIAKEVFLKHKISLKYKYCKNQHLIILNLKNIKIS